MEIKVIHVVYEACIITAFSIVVKPQYNATKLFDAQESTKLLAMLNHVGIVDKNFPLSKPF